VCPAATPAVISTSAAAGGARPVVSRSAQGPSAAYSPTEPSGWQTSGMVLGANARSTQLGGFVLLTREEQVLLVKQAYGLGLWALPGGLASPGETVEAAAVREANEETGLDVELGGVVGVADRGSVVLVVFGGSVRGGQLRAEPGEIEEVRWFNNEELLIMGDAFALARALASAAVEGSIGSGLVAGSVVGPDGGGHSVFWSMSQVGR
jgi:8-oxo-dGTP diphosphatase